jgi:hypothetical protein
MRFLLLALVAVNPSTPVLADSACGGVGSAINDLKHLGPFSNKFCRSNLGIPATATTSSKHQRGGLSN